MGDEAGRNGVKILIDISSVDFLATINCSSRTIFEHLIEILKTFDNKYKQTDENDILWSD